MAHFDLPRQLNRRSSHDKVSIFLTRRPDQTREEFVTYWTEKHTPLLASLPPGALQLHRYMQQQATDDEIPGIGTASYDGVAELWVDSVADPAAWFTSETYNSEIAADEENFLDRFRDPIPPFHQDRRVRLTVVIPTRKGSSHVLHSPGRSACGLRCFIPGR